MTYRFTHINLQLLTWAFSGPLTDAGPKRLPLCKMSRTYLAMMKLGTIIPYLKKIQKI